MTREEVYDKCVEKIGVGNGCVGLSTKNKNNIMWTIRELLPKEAIDAIIDCAVEEAVLALKSGEE